MRRVLRFDHLHHGDGWLSPGFLTVDDRGRVAAVAAEPPAGESWESIPGFALPGIPNAHGRSFLRALAGFGHSPSAPSREELAIALANAMDPDDLEAIAAMCHVEMLEAGYTAVGEFQGLHHDRDGKPFTDPGEMSLRVLAAAERTGIAVTLLPVLLRRTGFGLRLREEQVRFAWRDVRDYLACVESLGRSLDDRLHRVGIAVQGLGQVAPEDLDRAVLGITAVDDFAPIHVRIAVDRQEVEQCQDLLGARPISWLCGNQRVDARWCLVHATLAEPRELRLVAERGASVALCPSTEQEAGSGLFLLPEYAALGGRFAIGSGTHVAVDAAGELCALEYGLRAARQQGIVMTAAEPPVRRHVARLLFDRVVDAGARALAMPIGALQVGRRADFLVLDSDHPRLCGHGPETVLDAFVFSRSGRVAVREVHVAGRRVVENGRHVLRSLVEQEYREALARLL